jgi:hypothetical protein
MSTNAKERREPEPLKISCTRSDCENGLHCFKKSKRMAASEAGQCRSCGARLVVWERIRRRDHSDAEYTLQALTLEWVRHHCWCTPIDERAVLHARRKGRPGLRTLAEKRIRRSVGPAQPVRDGYQTPFEGNVIYYAQHATVCCCRTCIEYWHGVPKGEELTEEQIEYFLNLVTMFIEERMPTLTDAGEKIPARRARATGQE